MVVVYRQVRTGHAITLAFDDMTGDWRKTGAIVNPALEKKVALPGGFNATVTKDHQIEWFVVKARDYDLRPTAA